MGILLLLLGLLAVASGGFKLRGRVRKLLGRSPLALAETTVGALTVIGSGVGLARVRPLAWTIVVGVSGLILLASLEHVRKSVHLRREQEASEEARLKSHLGHEPGARAN
jgi:hypothetical protein